MIIKGTSNKISCDGLKDRACLGNPNIIDIRDIKPHSGRGGKRPGAGAKKGNINALKHGERSRNWIELCRQDKKHPGRGGKRPGAGRKKGNLNALKTGKHSKRITEFIKTDSTIKSMNLTEDQAREYVIKQYKHSIKD